LQRIVRRCLAKDPEQRYQNIKDVAIELKEVRRELQEHEVDTAVSTVSPASSKPRPAWQLETVRMQSQPGTAELPASTGVIVNELKRHKIAAIAGVLILAVVAVIGVRSYLRAKSTEVVVDSIAVIPFANEDKNPEYEWISDGLTESIINNLTQLPNLKVIARSSVFRYKGRESDPIAVGKELGVRAVLTGRIMQRGNTMMVSAELIDIRDNKQLWGEQYERQLADMLSVQREIAREITNNLRPTLSGVEQSRADKQYTANAEAFQLYLQGRFYWNKRTPADFQKAIAFFEQAIGKDPNYALAYSGLADTYAVLTAYTTAPARQVMPKAKEAALKALALDDTLAEAHASMGQIARYYDYDFSTAEREYRRAIELNPNYATAHQWLAEQLSALKRADEAISEMRRALELDPLSLIINRIYADILVAARRYDEAIEQYKKVIGLDPNFATTHFFLGRAYEAKGMYDEAVKEYSLAGGAGSASKDVVARYEVYKRSGWNAYLQTSLDQLVESSPERRFPPFVIATFYARANKRDETLAWLEKGYEERDFRITLLSTSFEFDKFRSDPKFKEIVRRMGLPE